MIKPAPHAKNERAEKTALVRAAVQTLPRQKSTVDMNTLRAVKPAKVKRVLRHVRMMGMVGWNAGNL